MRMFGTWHELEQIDDIHESYLDVRQVLPEQSRRGERLHRWDIAATRHDYIGLNALVVAGPVPNSRSLRAVLNRRFHIKVLKMHLLVRNDDIDVVDASQAVVRDGEQAVCVWWQVDPNDTRTFVRNYVKKTRVLMGEPVVILSPDQRSDQQIQ